MAEILDHVAYLSNEIGPRPAGTEEEQQAALYLTEQMQKETGLSAHMEDFESAPSPDLPRTICCSLSLIVVVLAFFLPVLWPAAIAVTLVSGILFVLEELDRPVLSRFLGKGVSQNVVARYEPGYSEQAGGTRRRKVILVSRYDSGKARPELREPFISLLPVVQKGTVLAMGLLPVLAALRFAGVGGEDGPFMTVVMVLMIVACLFSLVTVAISVIHKVSHYNDAANCNAAGVAVMLEVAKRVGTGRIPESEIAAQQSESFSDVHGAAAAYAADAVPEGAELVYDTPETVLPADGFGRVHAGSSHTAHPNSAVGSAAGRQGVPAGQSAPASSARPGDGLAAAKAAIAALTGQPVEGAAAVFSEVVDTPIATSQNNGFGFAGTEGGADLRAGSAAAPSALVAAPEADEGAADFEADESYVKNAQASMVVSAAAEQTQGSQSSVPDWYREAQMKAKRQEPPTRPVQRSRYAGVLDQAVVESTNHFAEANLIVEQRLEESLSAGREEIREVKAPQWSIPGTPLQAPAPAADASQAAADIGDEASGNGPAAADSEPVAIPEWLSAVAGAKEEAQDAAAHRTSHRVDVTQAPLDASGRIDVSLVPDAPRQAPQPIVLPDIGVSAANLTPITEMPKQRAPLAEDGVAPTAKSLLSMLPSITFDEISAEQAAGGQGGAEGGVAEALRGMPSLGKTGSVGIPLRSTMAGLSGAIPAVSANPSTTSSFAPVANALVNEALAQEAAPQGPVPAGVQAPVAESAPLPGATVSFAPVGEGFSDAAGGDFIIDDADDSAYMTSQNGVGTFGGPAYVEMPKSRMQRFLGKFHRKQEPDELEEVSAQEWLNVDETFDARTVGAQRGSWDSFRTEDAPASGAQSGQTPRTAGASQPFGARGRSGSFSESGAFVQPESQETPEPKHPWRARRSRDEFGIDGFDDDWSGGAYTPRRLEDGDLDSRDIAEEAAAAAAGRVEVSEELRQIYQFRNPDLNIEVWFVALGSELSGNSGMRAFMAEHQQDLRGSVIVELSALGAGDLCVVSEEGRIRSVKAPSRMTRYIRKATQASGVAVGSAKMKWHESAASYAMKQGCQALHLCGMDGQKPALFAQMDDTLDNVDERLLAENASFVMELLKNI